jgi:hypothetical protein
MSISNQYQLRLILINMVILILYTGTLKLGIQDTGQVGEGSVQVGKTKPNDPESEQHASE